MTKGKNRSLDTIADDIHKLERANIFDIGDLLIEAKEQCDHGQWLNRLDDEFDYAVTTAERYMNAARLRTKFPTVTNLKLAANTVYALADGCEDDDLTAIIQEPAKHATAKRLTHVEALRIIKIGIGRHRHGDYPDATLVQLAAADDDGDVVAALKARQPTTDEEAEAIVDEIEQARWEAEREANEARLTDEQEIEGILDGPPPELSPSITPPEPQKLESDSAAKWAGADEFADAVKGLFALSAKPVERFVGQCNGDVLRTVSDFLLAVMATTEKKAADKATEQVFAAGDANEAKLVWQTALPSRFDGHYIQTSTTSVSAFKITPTGSGAEITHYVLEVKPINSDWSAGKVIKRFGALDKAKAAAQAHADKAEAA